MTTEKLIYRVAEAYTKGVPRVDSRLRNRHIFNLLKSLRLVLVPQYKRKKRSLSNTNYQTLDCIPLCQAAVYECPCIPPMGSTYLRTKDPIPNILFNGDAGKHFIHWAGDLGGTLHIGENVPSSFATKNYTRYSKLVPEMVFYNGYIFIIGNWPHQFLRLSAIFENPDEVALLNNNYCNSVGQSVCPPRLLQEEFPIEPELIESLITMASQKLVAGVFTIQPLDQTPNSKQDINVSTVRQ